MMGSVSEIYHYGCDFSNTKINFLRDLKNVKLDISYQDFDYDYWKKFNGVVINCHCDFATIIKNPFLKYPSDRFILSLACDKGKIINYYKEIKNEDGEQITKRLEEYLKLDKEGHVRRLYDKIKHQLSLKGKYSFFLGSIYEQELKDIDLSDIPLIVLDEFRIDNNKLENIKINYSLGDLLKLNPEFILDYKDKSNVYNSFYTPGVNYSSWQENEGAKKRIATSKLTFFTKVYLELSRVCNANCNFCRNNSFEKCNYDLEKIKETLEMIKHYINALVIGGGEPTLKLDDVKILHESIKESKFDWHLFSNGTNRELISDDYIMDNFRLNISRHAVNDSDNANIFRVDSKKIMTTKELEKLNLRNNEVTLNAVCFKDGLDSFDKIIDYIKFAKDIGLKKVLIQDLQKSISLGNNDIKYNNMCIDESIFNKVREYLKLNGFREKYPIYATGGYVSYILKNKEGFSVTIQRYIKQEELDNEWSRAIKRTFDLSIDPSGNLYENWNQNNGLVKTLKK